MRVANIQRITEGSGIPNSYRYRSTGNADGSYHIGDLDDLALSDRKYRENGQKIYTDNFGLTRQDTANSVQRDYVVDYTSAIKNDLMVYEDGGFKTSYTYGANGRISQMTEHLSQEINPVTGKLISTTANEKGQNVNSDIAVEKLGKLYYHLDRLGSTAFITDESGTVRSYATYDEWGDVRDGGSHDVNIASIDATASFTTYTYDKILDKYFAQYRMYDAENRRFTAEDPVKDGVNWYNYVANRPLVVMDPWGLAPQAGNLVSGAYGTFAPAAVSGSTDYGTSPHTNHTPQGVEAELSSKTQELLIDFLRGYVDGAKVSIQEDIDMLAYVFSDPGAALDSMVETITDPSFVPDLVVNLVKDQFGKVQKVYFAVLNCDTYALGEVTGGQAYENVKVVVDYYVSAGVGAAAKAAAQWAAKSTVVQAVGKSVKGAALGVLSSVGDDVFKQIDDDLVKQAAKSAAKAFKNGELFERSMSLMDGTEITTIAETIIDGTTLTLQDIAIYSNVGDIPNAVGAQAFLEALDTLKQQAKAEGFDVLKITGQRAAHSTSANPGKLINYTFDLSK